MIPNGFVARPAQDQHLPPFDLDRALEAVMAQMQPAAPPPTHETPAQATQKKLQFNGYATFYGTPGETTAEGKPMDLNGMHAAMFQKGITLESSAHVQLASDPSKAIDVTVNDTSPFKRGPDGRAVYPLEPDPNIVIDLTPAAFAKLAPLSVGKIPVIVTGPFNADLLSS